MPDLRAPGLINPGAIHANLSPAAWTELVRRYRARRTSRPVER